MTLQNVTLDDKYDLSKSRVFVTGYQALIRACLMQQERAFFRHRSTTSFLRQSEEVIGTLEPFLEIVLGLTQRLGEQKRDGEPNG